MFKVLRISSKMKINYYKYLQQIKRYIVKIARMEAKVEEVSLEVLKMAVKVVNINLNIQNHHKQKNLNSLGNKEKESILEKLP